MTLSTTTKSLLIENKVPFIVNKGQLLNKIRLTKKGKFFKANGKIICTNLAMQLVVDGLVA